METKEQKQYYLFVKGERVAVTEEVYRHMSGPFLLHRRQMPATLNVL